MSVIILIIVGGIIGWLASLIMGTDSQQGLWANIIVGVVGSLLGKWIFADLLGISNAASAGSLSFVGVIWGIVGSIILILTLRLIRIFR